MWDRMGRARGLHRLKHARNMLLLRICLPGLLVPMDIQDRAQMLELGRARHLQPVMECLTMGVRLSNPLLAIRFSTMVIFLFTPKDMSARNVSLVFSDRHARLLIAVMQAITRVTNTTIPYVRARNVGPSSGKSTAAQLHTRPGPVLAPRHPAAATSCRSPCPRFPPHTRRRVLTSLVLPPCATAPRLARVAVILVLPMDA